MVKAQFRGWRMQRFYERPHKYRRMWISVYILYVCVCSYFHNPIPVVASGHPKQCEEGHPKILKGRMTAQTLTWVVVIAL